MLVDSTDKTMQQNQSNSNSSNWTREAILDRAKECVMKDRNATHGNPEDNFKTIAKYWSTYLKIELGAIDVAAMMILMKMSRLHSSPTHHDHWVDIAGYAACGGEVATKKVTKPDIKSYIRQEPSDVF
jgi:hypothetical protein